MPKVACEGCSQYVSRAEATYSTGFGWLCPTCENRTQADLSEWGEES